MNVKNFNPIWEKQSVNSGESMPCGGYDCGANVWVENDQLLFYIDRSGSFDENNQMLKLGRFRFSFSENVFENFFEQELHLESGNITVSGDHGFVADIWFDVTKPVCHVDIKCNKEISVKVSYETWRTEEREIPQDERMAPASYQAYPGYVATYPDDVKYEDGKITFYHKNRNDKLLFDFLVELQNLSAIKDKLDNFQKDLIFGGCLVVPNGKFIGVSKGEYAYVPYVAYTVLTESKRQHNIMICFHKEQNPDTEQWKRNLEKLYLDNESDFRMNTIQWWNNFWKRSYLYINDKCDNTDKGKELAQNYNLFRYMLGCNAYGEYPTKFNGGLFTTDAVFSTGEEHKGKTPDFRRWGGGSFTGQNQRLVYWGMLKSGDFDMMPSQFDFYARALNNACLKTKEYWNHGGCSFTEQVENLGLPIGWTWGFEETYDDPVHVRPKWYDPTEQISPWIRYYYASQLEFSYMILKYYDYTGADISKYIPFIENCVTFYVEHYKFYNYRSTLHELDPNGKLCISPSCGLEAYRDAVNPTEVVCGLRAVICGLIKIPEYVDSDYYQELLKIIPEIPLGEKEGLTVFEPATVYRERVGDEFSELYPVYPYEFCNVGSSLLETGINTWNTREVGWHTYVSWRQEPIFAARLGLTEEANNLIIKKLQSSGRRFPAFWGPGHDWNPDHNWGGSGMIAIQEMLLQEYDGKIYLLPAWNREWEVNFRFHLTGNAYIDVCYEKGILEYTLTGDKNKFEIINCLER